MGYKRAFIHLKDSWYGNHILSKHDYLDEVTFGLYDETDGGTIGELSMNWYEIGNDIVPVLKVYNDAFRVMNDFSDILQTLSDYNEVNFIPKQFCEILNNHGFTDATERQR